MALSDRERVPVVVVPEEEDLAHSVAARIAEVIRERRAAGNRTVLGLATGSTPIGIYRELIRLHREEGLDFSDVVAFNLDEYYPMERGSIHSLKRYMAENLFDHINIPPENLNIPRGDLPRHLVPEHCLEYEESIRQAGGIDFQILGIGQTGHIGFNEPGSSLHSRTRLVALDTMTRRTAAQDFFGEDNVPLEAITMGVATILEAREIALLATGEHKADIVRRSVEGDIDPNIAATYLQQHPNATFYLDGAAAAELARIKMPWALDVVEWTPDLELRALIWLSEVTGKSLLKLDDLDYHENHLSSLIARYGSAGALNGQAFNTLISRIRGRSKLAQGKRIVIFSPHPDDDVISAGGVLHKLQQNGNEIVVAYQTSGSIAVFDHEVRRYLDFLRRTTYEFEIDGDRLNALISDVESFLERKAPGEVDSEAVQKLKRTIREAEAVSAIEALGLAPEQARFLNLPFYQTGKVRKDPIGPRDIEITLQLLEEFRPDLVFIAGDLSDPHGTHRMCKEAIELALRRYTGAPPEVWYYRGAWQEWPVAEADILVPLSRDELRLKIMAIFRHQSQKDKAPFPGIDDREFWQRVEERNQNTARIMDRLGLPEYFAMEAYVVRQDGQPLETVTIPTSALASWPEHPGPRDRPVIPAEPAREKV
jgi:glucosamine-6-phosphate deaminase